MPLIPSSTYRAPWFFRQAHLNTIIPALLRPVAPLPYERTTPHTPDDDFVDLDWLTAGHDRLVIALHGLEGSADRPYIRGLMQYFTTRGWDGLAFNFRSCSGRPNRQIRSYHMGATADVKLAVGHALEQGYREIALVGFSLGGNVLLKYFGEEGEQLPAAVIGGVAFSVPCHIPTANVAIAHRQNRLYLWRFLKTLNRKMAEKVRRFPNQLSLPARMPRSFYEFDDFFTGPMHGFRGAEHYWESCSSLNFMPDIHRPVLLVNAQDDTFLSPSCFPVELARQHDFLFLETPSHGGHCGFMSFDEEGGIWSEQRAWVFLEQYSQGQS
ncbi:MAG: alpha/beta fold hydrolase [Lewinella sp.]|nr:alpha/beta fold hydrolase [Lewinella sp.]